MTGPTPDGFYDLTNESDRFGITFDLLARSPQGLRGLGGNDDILGSTYADIINGNAGNDLIDGSNGNDYLRGGQGDDVLRGGQGDDTLNGNVGKDHVSGGEGNDFLRGGRGSDLLLGDMGNDTLIGDVGGDLLAGNEGNDLFMLDVLPVGADILLDFNASVDRIGIPVNFIDPNFPDQFIGPLSFRQENIPLELLEAMGGFVDISEPRPGMHTREFRILLNDFNVDPDGDRRVNATTIMRGGSVLGIALNASEAEVRNSIVPVLEYDLRIG